jgi:protein-tyrosine phosphatase
MSYGMVVDGLFQGNQHSTMVIQNDSRSHIYAIISIGCRSKHQDSAIISHRFAIKDSADSDIRPLLGPVTALIEKLVEGDSQSVLLHCQGGINRSPAFVVAYLCRFRGYSIESAQQLLKLRRPSARMQPHYMVQIEEWLMSEQLGD